MAKESMSAPFKGQCLCGAIQYEADEIAAKYAHCHCTMCRKFHGAAFSTYGAAHRSAFRWLRGADQLTSFKAENGTTRQFCKHCGSSMTFATDKEPEAIEFSLATLDQAPPLKPDAHLHIDSKVTWLDLGDNSLKKFNGNRD